MGRMGVCMMCVCDGEEREWGLGVGVNTPMMSSTLVFVIQLFIILYRCVYESLLIDKGRTVCNRLRTLDILEWE